MDVPIVTRWIAEEEWYPVYELRRKGDPEFETEVQIPETLVHKYAQAYGDFKAVQKALRKLYEKED